MSDVLGEGSLHEIVRTFIDFDGLIGVGARRKYLVRLMAKQVGH